MMQKQTSLDRLERFLLSCKNVQPTVRSVCYPLTSPKAFPSLGLAQFSQCLLRLSHEPDFLIIHKLSEGCVYQLLGQQKTTC